MKNDKDTIQLTEAYQKISEAGISNYTRNSFYKFPSPAAKREAEARKSQSIGPSSGDKMQSMAKDDLESKIQNDLYMALTFQNIPKDLSEQAGQELEVKLSELAAWIVSSLKTNQPSKKAKEIADKLINPEDLDSFRNDRTQTPMADDIRKQHNIN
jgi:hypothetical protein